MGEGAKESPMMQTRSVRAVFSTVLIVAVCAVATGVSSGVAFASGAATLHLSAPKIETGTSIVIRGTALPRSALRYDNTNATVVLYEVGKTSDTQLGGEETVPANGKFTITQPVASGTRTYSVQFIPVGGLTPVSATIKITLTR
jgi:hypothetical protein